MLGIRWVLWNWTHGVVCPPWADSAVWHTRSMISNSKPNKSGVYRRELERDCRDDRDLLRSSMRRTALRSR